MSQNSLQLRLDKDRSAGASAHFVAVLLLFAATLHAAVPSTNEFLFIDNGQVRLGVHTNWGAGIAWFSESGGSNLVNHWDHGRLIQQSYYGSSDGSLWNKKPWRWNPVQGGDWRGHPAKVLSLQHGTNTLWARSQGKHWASGEDLTNVLFEESIQLTGRVARIHFKMTYSCTNSHPRVPHELPAIFINPALPILALYDGAKPWSGGPISRSNPGWPNESRKMAEHWAAYVNTNDWGIGAYIPVADTLTCYRYAAGKRENQGACSYFAPVKSFPITPGMVFEYDVWLSCGDLAGMRERFARLASPSRAAQ